MISLIFAVDQSYLLGNGFFLPWSIEEDLLYYKKTVHNKTILVGYNTYLSLQYYHKHEPLPYKKIYLITSRPLKVIEPVHIVKDLEAFIQQPHQDLFVIGGLMVFKSVIDYADYIYLSRIKGTYNGGIYYHDLETDLKPFKLINERQTDWVRYQIYKRS